MHQGGWHRDGSLHRYHSGWLKLCPDFVPVDDSSVASAAVDAEQVEVMTLAQDCSAVAADVNSTVRECLCASLSWALCVFVRTWKASLRTEDPFVWHAVQFIACYY